MKTLLAYEVGKHLWQAFAKADRLVNKLAVHDIEGCRFELFDDGTGQELQVKVPAHLLRAAQFVMQGP
jgi:hypothetical protein